ncbi:A/G-specific adenine glycosylase [Bengtsoniella intestinalis]|uniref:A/G-specific adenine glycosylase n=1 Tax=Bengtsoniella intestinalis TaxID=3073143 RepID=UPI00391F01C8
MKESYEIAQPLLAWYRQNARDLPWRHTQDPYAIWVSEIMLQQTRVAAVLGYYARFLTALPTVADLAAMDEDKLMKLWQGLGYYSRARNLQKAAQTVMADHGGQFPQSVEGLKALAGIGDYTAGAIGSAAFGLQTAAVDGNVLRVVSRLLDCHHDITLPATKKEFTAWIEEQLPPAGDDMRQFNQAVMELGATLCGPNAAPQCAGCPLQGQCLAHSRGTAEKLPVKAPKKPRRKEERTVFVLTCNGKVLLRKRPATGLLAKLWEFPNVEGHMDETAVAQQLQSWGITPVQWQKRLTATHIFTHVEWDMVGYCVEVADVDALPKSWVWADGALHDHAVPSAFGRFVETL